jgi:hypothetical protein
MRQAKSKRTKGGGSADNLRCNAIVRERRFGSVWHPICSVKGNADYFSFWGDAGRPACKPHAIATDQLDRESRRASPTEKSHRQPSDCNFQALLYVDGVTPITELARIWSSTRVNGEVSTTIQTCQRSCDVRSLSLLPSIRRMSDETVRPRVWFAFEKQAVAVIAG